MLYQVFGEAWIVTSDRMQQMYWLNKFLSIMYENISLAFAGNSDDKLLNPSFLIS